MAFDQPNPRGVGNADHVGTVEKGSRKVFDLDWFKIIDSPEPVYDRDALRLRHAEEIFWPR